MDRWYPKRARSDRHYDIFTLARYRDPKAVPLLIGLVNDLNEGVVVRAGAARFLGEFEGETVAAALIKALDDQEIMVRAEAARSLSEVRSQAAVEPLKRKLTDGNAAVRLNAVFALMKMNILELQGPEADTFRKVKAEYKQFLVSFPTIYDIRVDLGTFNALHGDYAAALQEYKNAVKLNPDLPTAYYYVGITYARIGQFEPALNNLQKALEIDPKFRNAAQLIQQIKELIGKK
jgi:tetratricopeptide (TPR) repeat protein